MDNQHKLIKGYRDLSKAEIDLMNEIKEHGLKTAALIDKVLSTVFESHSAESAWPWNDPDKTVPREYLHESLRWSDTARSSLQTGQMQLIRALALPGGF